MGYEDEQKIGENLTEDGGNGQSMRQMAIGVAPG